MKKFNFRLQKVMEFKEDIEKQKMGELAQAENVLLLEVDKLEVLKKRESEYVAKVNDMREQGIIHPAEMESFCHYIDKLKIMQTVQIKQIAKAEKNVEAKRQILIKATQEKKIFEKLKEKQLAEYEAEFARQEQIFFDEIASNKFGRKEETRP